MIAYALAICILHVQCTLYNVHCTLYEVQLEDKDTVLILISVSVTIDLN